MERIKQKKKKFEVKAFVELKAIVDLDKSEIILPFENKKARVYLE